jgi:hypothetical protein
VLLLLLLRLLLAFSPPPFLPAALPQPGREDWQALRAQGQRDRACAGECEED